MMFRTHVITALAVAGIGIQQEVLPMPTFFDQDLDIFNYSIALIIVAIGGLFPDIDHNRSFISNKLGFNLSWFFKHRGPTHTIWPYLAMIGFGFYENTYLSFFLFWLGIGSLLHIYGDMHTKSGVKLFGFGKHYRVLPKSLNIKTGGAYESFFFLVYLSIFGFASFHIAELGSIIA